MPEPAATMDPSTLPAVPADLPQQEDEPEGYRLIRMLIVAYCFLLLFEGVLRKWVVPQWSPALLVVRDPIVIAVYVLALRFACLPRHWLLTATLFLASAALCADITSGLCGRPLDVYVMVYGLRANFLHIPLIAVMGVVLRRRDVQRLATWTLLLAPAVVGLALAQSLAPAGSALNKLAGETKGYQLAVAFGLVRPTSVFTSPLGYALFLGLLAAFVWHDCLSGPRRSAVPFLLGAFSLAIGVAVCGSRFAFWQVVLVSVVALSVALVSLFQTSRFRPSLRLVVSVLVLVLAAAVAILMPSFAKQRSAFAERMERAAYAETFQEPGLDEFSGEPNSFLAALVRTFNGFSIPLQQLGHVPLLGDGLGTQTAAGSQLLHGQPLPSYTIGGVVRESEWTRLLLESGVLAGLMLIIFRTVATLWLGVCSWRALRRGEALPAILFAVAGPLLLCGNASQVTSLGFMVVTAGLAHAVCLSPGRDGT